MSNRQICLQRPLGELNRRLADKIEKAKPALSTRRFDRVHHDVLQNQLDTMFLIRKKKLLNICKQNKLIFEKIHTQKSAYPKQQFDQAYQTNRQIGDRMLKSKEKLRSKFFEDGESLMKRTIQTRSGSQDKWRRHKLPSLEQRAINFYNQMYKLPLTNNVPRVATVTVLSSKKEGRDSSQSSRVRDFMLF